MLKAFFDASGTLNQVENYVLAGYISTVEKWERFSDDWQLALEEPPKIDYFKIREAILRIEQFDGWEENIATARATKFRRIVTSHVLGGFAVVLPTDLYKKHVHGKIPKEMDHPFYFCFLRCIKISAKMVSWALPGLLILFLILKIWMVHGKIPKEMDHPFYFCFLRCIEISAKMVGSMGFAGPIDFVFDTENLDVGARAILEDFKRWPWKHSDLVGELDFREYKKVLALQSADMIAWLLRTHLDNSDVELHEEMSLEVKPAVAVAAFTENKLIRYMDTFHKALQEIDPTGKLLKLWKVR